MLVAHVPRKESTVNVREEVIIAHKSHVKYVGCWKLLEIGNTETRSNQHVTYK